MVLDCPIIKVTVEKYGTYAERVLPSEKLKYPGLTHILKQGLHIAEVPLEEAVKHGYKILGNSK